MVLPKWCSRRYFIPVYITLWLAFLISFEHLQLNTRLKKYFLTLLVITVFIGGVGSLYHLKYIRPQTLTPRAEVARQFAGLGNIGIISEYWNHTSILVSCLI